MYVMKNIITQDEIILPKCMYYLKPIYNSPDIPPSFVEEEIDINISNQVIKFLKVPNPKMSELEKRQDQLLKKLDILYDRIKIISSFCEVNSINDIKTKKVDITFPEEVVLIFSPHSLPWYLKYFLKESSVALNVTWHIHSSVPKEKQSKIKAFLKNIPNAIGAKVNLRLIFECVSADMELRLSALSVPVIGNVNILRYLSYMYPNVVPYDQDDYFVDSLLDHCHVMERSADKIKGDIINKIFSQYKNWIYKGKFSIVDLAAYNAIKQSHSGIKSVPKEWFEKCEKMCM